ncbi:MAG: Protein of unknown function transrane [Bacillales bacterium]|jgi:hypothetical protein|nr:Protein of unknown function transrane [Bacillales bacterium]
MIVEIQKRLVDIKESQLKILEDYEKLLKDYDSNGLVSQNEELRNKVADFMERLAHLEAKFESVSNENQKLRISLKEQVLDEKLNILKISRSKLDTYFKSTEEDCQNRLTAFEKHAEKEISKLKTAAARNLSIEQERFVSELNQWAQNLGEKIREYREHLSAEAGGVANLIQSKFDDLMGDGVAEEVIQKRIRQNETEMKIGLNWINKIGIILILFGIGAAAKYVHSTWFTDYMRGAPFFIFGGVFLAGGEYLNGRGKDIFARVLLGGGVSILRGQRI